MSDIFGGNATVRPGKTMWQLAHDSNKKRKQHKFMIKGNEVTQDQFNYIKASWRK